MSRLAGEFAIMVIFTAPGRLSQVQLSRAFGALAKQLQLSIHLKSLESAETVPRPFGRPYLLSVYGADRPGIVYRVSNVLGGLGVNITDVSTHLSAPINARQAGRTKPTDGKSAKPLYLMVLEVELPPRVSESRLGSKLQSLAKQLEIEVSLRAAEADVL